MLSPSEHLSLPGLEFLTVPAQGECLGDESDDAFCRFIVDNDEMLGFQKEASSDRSGSALPPRHHCILATVAAFAVRR